jgi:hypothetical protein
MHPKTPQDDPADALDEGANELAEAIAFGFGAKREAPSVAPARTAVWGRWFRTATITGGSAYEIVLGAPSGVPRPAH